MTKLIACLTLAIAASFGIAQAIPTVNVSAKGVDVRSVLHDLFGQAKKNFVIDPGVRFVLYLSLSDIEFEEALQLVCKTASLKYELQNGIYFVSVIKPSREASKPVAKPVVAKPKGKLSETVLNRTLTTRYDKVDIRVLFAEISKQTKVDIEIDKAVPAYKLDAYLMKTSLKFALQTICDAARLKYSFTENQTILLQTLKDGEGSKVALAGG